MCIDLETIAQPLAAKIKTAGWNSNNPVPAVPRGKLSKYHPLCVQYAMTMTIERVVGIGVPSKYLDFPAASFGRD